MSDTMKVSVYLPRELHKKAKMMAIEKDQSLSEFFEEAVRIHISRGDITARETPREEEEDEEAGKPLSPT